MLEALYIALSAVVPVFLVIALGAWLRRQGSLPDNAGRVLGVFVLKLALPLLVLHLMAQAQPQDLARGSFWLGGLGAQSLMFALVWGVDRLALGRGRGEAVIAGMNASINNVGFVGLAIILNLFPGNTEALLVTGLVIFATNLGISLTQSWLDCLSGGVGGWRGLLQKLAGNPLLLAVLCGMVLACTGLGLWEPLDRTARLLGHTAAPCMLLALGYDVQERLALVHQQRLSSVLVRQGWIVGCKLLLHPLLCWLLLWLLGVDGLWLTVSVLLSATAAALVNAVMAEVHDANPTEAALSVLLSNGLSLFSLTGFIWLFIGLGMA